MCQVCQMNPLIIVQIVELFLHIFLDILQFHIYRKELFIRNVDSSLRVLFNLNIIHNYPVSNPVKK